MPFRVPFVRNFIRKNLIIKLVVSAFCARLYVRDICLLFLINQRFKLIRCEIGYYIVCVPSFFNMVQKLSDVLSSYQATGKNNCLNRTLLVYIRPYCTKDWL